MSLHLQLKANDQATAESKSEEYKDDAVKPAPKKKGLFARFVRAKGNPAT